MPRMPEITGERVEPIETDLATARTETRAEILWHEQSTRVCSRMSQDAFGLNCKLTRTRQSSMRLRLDDFSGEGERGPPP
jgi:hypothetical protein